MVSFDVLKLWEMCITRESSESTPAVIDVTQVDVARLSGKQTVAILSPLHCYRALRNCNRLLHWESNDMLDYNEITTTGGKFFTKPVA